MNNFAHVTPEWIRGKLKESGISQNELAGKIGTNPQRLSEWMNGSNMLSTTKAAIYYYFANREI